MRSLKEIKAEQEANRANIERLKADINRLNCKGEIEPLTEGRFTEERRAAVKAIIAKRKANESRIAEKCSELFIANVKTRILNETVKAALFNEAYPAILEVFKKYNGKPYGEKTREKIRLEIKAAGYSVYIGKKYSDCDTLYITELDNGFSHPACVSCEASARDENGRWTTFINSENKIVFADVNARSESRYTEDAEQEARKVAEAIKDYTEATKAIEKKRRELSDILPEGISKPKYIDEYNIIFA